MTSSGISTSTLTSTSASTLRQVKADQVTEDGRQVTDRRQVMETAGLGSATSVSGSPSPLPGPQSSVPGPHKYNMRKTVYVETSIVSYLAARPSRDVMAAAWQQLTTQWWDVARPRYELFTSELVFVEASRGDSDGAARRLEYLKGIPTLKADEKIEVLAERLIAEGAMPPSAEADALHIAIAAVHGIDYLLTWNCRHIDNAELRPLLRFVCDLAGYRCPEICTPLELLVEEVDNV